MQWMAHSPSFPTDITAAADKLGSGRAVGEEGATDAAAKASRHPLFPRFAAAMVTASTPPGQLFTGPRHAGRRLGRRSRAGELPGPPCGSGRTDVAVPVAGDRMLLAVLRSPFISLLLQPGQNAIDRSIASYLIKRALDHGEGLVR